MNAYSDKVRRIPRFYVQSMHFMLSILSNSFKNERTVSLEDWYTYVLKFPSLTGEVRRELETFYTTLQNNLRLHNLATNPLLLTVMASLYHYQRLPDKRVDLYKECADLLLDTWAKLKYKEPRFKEMKMSQGTQRDCLAHLGLFLHTRSQEEQEDETDTREEDNASEEDNDSEEDTAVDVPVEEMQREIERFLRDENLLSGAEIKAEAERFLDLVKTEAGLIVERGTDERGPLYGFVHRTFQEYFAAVSMVEQSKDEPTILSDFLEEHLHDPHWNEVILLLIGQLRHKQLTVLFRRILKSEIKSHRSKYTDIVQQDLLFVCACLAEDITVEQTFAEDVFSRIESLVKKSPFPTQCEQALEVLGALMRTKQYASLGQQKLKAFVFEDSIADTATRIYAAQILYLNSPHNSDERGLAIQMLPTLQAKLPFEQQREAAQSLYSNSPPDSEEERWATHQLYTLAQQEGLSFEQQREAARSLYLSSPDDSEERRWATHQLYTLAQQEGLSFDQQREAAEFLYRNSPDDSEEQLWAAQRLWKLAKNQNYTVDQRLQAATVPLVTGWSSYSDRAKAIRIVVEMLEKEKARHHLSEHWQSRYVFLDEKIAPADIPLIIELAQQELLPVKARDEMYQILCNVVAQFDKIDTVNE